MLIQDFHNVFTLIQCHIPRNEFYTIAILLQAGLLFKGLIFLLVLLGCPRGVMVKAMNCGIVVLQSRYYVHFRANTLGKGMNPLILPPAMGK